MRRRSSSEASTARTSSISRSCWLRRRRRASRQASGTWTSQRRTRLASRSAGEGEPDPAARRGDGSPALVRLEEQRRPVRRPDREIDLVQAALALLESVLGPVEVAELGARSRPYAATSSFESSSGYRRPDQPRLVGVDDASVGSPDLHPHDALAEHAFLDDPCRDARSAARSPSEHAVARAPARRCPAP